MYLRDWFLHWWPSRPVDFQGTRCVKGHLTTLGNLSIDYDFVKPPPANSTTSYDFLSKWVWEHEVDAIHMGWGENITFSSQYTCQFRCKHTKNCASYAGFWIRDSNPSLGGLTCYFYSDTIDQYIFVPRSVSMSGGITRELVFAYNNLCDFWSDQFADSYRDSVSSFDD